MHHIVVRPFFVCARPIKIIMTYVLELLPNCSFFFYLSFRAAQKVASSSGSRRVDTNAGGFCGALQRAPPPVPPALARRLANRENLGFGKVSATVYYV